MSTYPTNRYVPGTYKRECARCGTDHLRSEMVKERWSGLVVCKRCLYPEPQHLKPRRKIKEKPFKRD
jgi:hypothetical protein